MAYAVAAPDVQPFQPKSVEPISTHGGVVVVLNARFRAFEELAKTSEFWRRSTTSIDAGLLPASMRNLDGVTWTIDDEDDEYQVVEVRQHIEPSVDDVP